ncbi:hypothetical protein [Streptomyces puniciscabiei]|uniref:hypothetical protein n=1 Tax=Streptomyces puniciscabiei TaxID=164348 RepID=UPI003331E3CB
MPRIRRPVRRRALTVAGPADLAARGDLAEGAPGSRVTVTATLRNDGPGWIRTASTRPSTPLRYVRHLRYGRGTPQAHGK